jgi:hypothetical protein
MCTIGGFLPFVEKQCVQYSSSGNVVYDFKKAEQYLLDVYFSGKPLIDLEVRMVQYANSQGMLLTHPACVSTMMSHDNPKWCNNR